MKKREPFIDREGHLTDEGISLWLDHLQDPQGSPLPSHVATHGEECLFCRGRVVDMALLVEAEEAPEAKPDPARYRSASMTSLHAVHPPAHSSGSNRRLWFALAAVLLLLIATMALLYLPGRHTSTSMQELFANHFVPYPDAVTTKSQQDSGDSLDALFRTGMQAYASGEYDTALRILAGIHLHQPRNQPVAFYLAMAKLALLSPADASPEANHQGEAGEADAGYDALGVADLLLPIARGEGPYAMPSRWYLALTSVAMEDPAMARYWLGRIPAKERYYSEKAALLLNELKE